MQHVDEAVGPVFVCKAVCPVFVCPVSVCKAVSSVF